MVDQTSVNGEHARSAQTLPEGVHELVGDLATMVELQARLAALDGRETAQAAALPVMVAIGALTLVVSGVAAGLFGAALLLALALKIHTGWAMLVASVVAMTIGTIAFRVALRRVEESFASFRRSREELQRNMAWVRGVVRR